VALFAGRLGLKPFRSMIRLVRENDPPRRLTLVYANPCPEQAAFLEELEARAKDNPNFRLLATMNQPE
jgi:ferredoxin-NADP reductase